MAGVKGGRANRSEHLDTACNEELAAGYKALYSAIGAMTVSKSVGTYSQLCGHVYVCEGITMIIIATERRPRREADLNHVCRVSSSNRNGCNLGIYHI